MSNAYSENKWKSICKHYPLSEDIIRLNQYKVYWPYVFKYQRLSISFLTEFITKVTEHNAWDDLATYQSLTTTFITAYKDYWNWDLIFQYQDVVDRFTMPLFAPINSISGSSPYYAHVLKSEMGTISQTMSSLAGTDVQILGNNVVGNNGTQVGINFAETETEYVVELTSYNTVGVTDLGYIQFNSTGSDLTSTGQSFLDGLVSGSTDYRYKANNTSNPFRESFQKYQTLSWLYIDNNKANLDFTLLSQWQQFNEFWIMYHDSNSTTTGTLADYTFDWDKLCINQTMKYLLDTEWSWVSSLINYQLLLKYQNLSNSFITTNVTNFPLDELGRWNKNLSTQDLVDIQTANPWFTESTARLPSIKFEYLKSEQLEDLESAGFEIKENKVTGYVKYRRNGSLLNNNKYNFNGDVGDIISTLQVNLKEDSSGEMVGIPVITGNDVLADEERNKYLYAKVELDITNRDISTYATGSLQFSNKNDITDYDRLSISDGDNRHIFSFIKSGAPTDSIAFTNKISGTSNSTTNIVTTTSEHHLQTGDAIRVDSSPQLPMVIGSTYYAIRLSSTTFYVASTLANALANIPISFTASGATVLYRFDSKFTIATDLNIYTGLKVSINDTVAPATGLTNWNTYYVIKDTEYVFRLADTYNEALRYEYVEISTAESGVSTMYFDTYFIDLQAPSVTNQTHLHNIMERIIDNFQILEIPSTDVSKFVEYPPFPTVKNAETETAIDYSHTIASTAFDTSSNRITLGTNNLAIQDGDPVTLDSTGNLPIYSSISTPTQTVGTGLDDLSSSGHYTGSTIDTYEIKIVTAGTVVTSINLSTDTVTAATHGLVTGDAISVSANPRAPMVAGTIYYVIYVDANNFKVATSYVNALAGTNIDFTESGASTLYTQNEYQWRLGTGAWSSSYNIEDGVMPIDEGLYISFGIPTEHTVGDTWQITVGTRMDSFSVTPATTYYAHKISDEYIELALTYSDALAGNAIDIIDSGTGNHTINSSVIHLSSDIDIYTGNCIAFSGANIPTGIVANTRYYVIKQTPTRIILATNLANAFAGTHFNIASSGGGTYTLTTRDVNIVNTGDACKGIIHYINTINTTGYLFVEIVSGSGFAATDNIDNTDVFVGTESTISAVTNLSLSGTQLNNILNLTNTKAITSASDGNEIINRYLSDINSIQISGMSGGYEDTITDANASGIGCIIQDENKLRAYQVEIIEVDHEF